MKIDLRSRLFLSQAAILAVIMIVLAIFMGFMLNRILISNLDQFLHQQADNYKATMSFHQGRITFHDLNPDFEHTKPLEEEIPFHVQMLDMHYQTIMLSGNLQGHSLYQGGQLPHRETYETLMGPNGKIRRLVTPLRFRDSHIGWIIVSLSYHYLDDFRDGLWYTVALATLAAIVLLTISSYIFVRWSLRPVIRLAERVNLRAAANDLEALPLPEGDDEFVFLTKTYNDLLLRAKSSMEALERFTADASHELKTPLAVMRSELLRLEDHQVKQEAYSTGTLHEEIVRMQQLIENLLILSQTDLPYESRHNEVWLNDFLTDETSRLQQVYTTKKLRFDLDEVESIKVNTDIYLLYLVYNNLLRNAVRHSPSDATIRITCKSDEQQKDVEIAVIDSGPGIPEEKLQLIFDRFYRLDTSRSRQAGGSGLGLSIAQWAAEKLQGSISLQNREEGGLIASFILKT